MDDVVLAVQARVGWEFGGRIPKEVRTISLAFAQIDGNVLRVVHSLSSSANKFSASSLRPRSIRGSLTPTF